MAEIVAAIKRGDPEEQVFVLPPNVVPVQNQSNYWTPPMAPPFVVPNQTYIPVNNSPVQPLASTGVPPAPAALSGTQAPHQMYPAPLVTQTAASGIAPTGENLAPPQAYVTTAQMSVATGGTRAPLNANNGTPAQMQNSTASTLINPMDNLALQPQEEVSSQSLMNKWDCFGKLIFF